MRSLLGLIPLPRAWQADLEAMAKHQEEIIQLMTVLPRKCTYEQVASALSAAAVPPVDLYYSLCANDKTPALARFYEALDAIQQNEAAS